MQDIYLQICLEQIESKLDWGPSSAWTTQDFEELSIRIQDETGQVISATTLKRIWGRVTYDSNPSRHSLDSLARFLGYTSWRNFNSSVDLPPPASPSRTSVEPANITLPRRIPTTLLSIFMLMLGASLVIWLGLRYSNTEATSYDNIKFVSRPLSDDLPNTVIFEYDVSEAPGDSFFIQQSWDSNLRTRVSPDNNVHTSTYYFPGYYNAKLIANDDVLMELPVHIKTNGWAVMLEGINPLYLPEESLLSNGTLALSRDWLLERGYDIDSGEHRLGYYYVQDFGPLHTDNFTMEAIIRHIKPDTRRPCQGGQVNIRGEDGFFNFPFDIPGCAGVMHVFAGDVHHAGDSHDLSTLGTDYSNWQSVSMTVKDKQVSIQIGTNPPYTLAFEREMGKFVGLWFQFVGRGEIDEIRLKDGNGRVIYEETF